jgi:hypothetical protein
MTRPSLKRLTAAISGILAMALTTPLQAAELKVIAGGSMTALLRELAPPFEKTTGHKLSIHFDSTPNIINSPSTSSRTPPRRPASRLVRPSISRASAMALPSAPARRSLMSPRRRR